MAVRPQHVHDGGIVERRLRPIYDWLDYGNNKKALQEAEKVLKKSPSLQAARALKALALLRLGKSVEAHTVLDALADEKPSDDTTLQAMSISYRESQQLHRVCVLYEAAVKEEPLSEELHSHLFMAYVRVGDYRAQQRAAMALYKFAPKNPYYFWAVMSIVLQAKESEDTTKKNILLSLAQRMVDNFITENKVEAEQEARLYIMILELQEKWEEILKFIDSPLYTQLVPGSNAPARIPYLQKLGRWKELNLLCKELLFDNQDRWDYYLPYLDSIFELLKEPPNDDNSVDDTAEKCHEFICQLVESMTSGRTLRGPYLARLELWKRLSKDGDPTALMGSGVALCVQYLRVFAHKPCAVPDLRPYLSMIPQKDREEHCRDFLTCLGLNENSMPETTDDIQRHVSCLSSWLLTAAPVSGAEYLTLASAFRRQYERALRCGYVTSTQTEFCAADGYAILAVHMYFFAAVGLGRSWPWLSAAALLETALQHSPANFHAKLLLLTLYHLLGNAHAADTVYVRLEAKHVQLVSLGWLHAARLPATAAPRALQLLADTRAFHHHHAKDSVDHLTYAYKYGTFEKLSALYSWRARLAMCAGGAMAARARALAALLAAPADRPPAPDPLPKEPTDNRDLNVIVNYEPPQFHNPKLKEQTFERDLAFLRLKDGLVSAIALCIELAENRPAEEKKPLCEQLKTCIEAFSMAMDKCKERYHEKERLSISTPFPSKIIAFVNSPVPYRELYDSILSVVLALATPSSGESAHARTKRAAASVSAAKALLPRREDGQDRGWTMRERMEDVSNYLEFIGVVTFLLGICKEIVTPTNNVKKSKKKANQSPEEVKTHELLNTLNDAVQESIEYLEEIFDNWPSYDFDTSLEEEFKEPEAREKHLAAVVQKLKTGQQDMVNDVKNMLRNKLKYLKSLK